MKKIKKYLNIYLVTGILILLVVGFSWIKFPWNQTQGGIFILSGQVIFSVIGLVDAALGIHVSWKTIKGENHQTPQNNINLAGAQSVANGPNAQATSTYIEKQIHIKQIITPELEIAHAEKSKQRYLDAVIRRCQMLNFNPLGKEGSEISLEQIYIDLDSTEQVPIDKNETKKRKQPTHFGSDDEIEALPVLKAAARSPRLVLLGDPGSGKSTFIKKLCGWLAYAGQHGTEPPEGFSGPLIPLMLTLRDVAASLRIDGFEKMSHDEQMRQMLHAFKQQLKIELHDLDAADFEQGLLDTLKNGLCLLALDGLDEVPYDLRQRVRSFVDAVIESYPIERILITCRIRSYSDKDTKLPSFGKCTLAPFDEEKITNFIEAWYNTAKDQYKQEELEKRKINLKSAALAEKLREMAANPMLLTVMAIIHQQDVELPPQKVKLYRRAVEILLLRWQKHKSGEYTFSENLQKFLTDEGRVYPALYRLAYEAHRTRKDQENSDSPELLRKEALDILERNECRCKDGSSLANEFLDYCDQRSGLFLGKGGSPGTPHSYTFPHRTFQEYLAGCYLASNGRSFARTLSPLAAQGDTWDVAVLMAIEELYYNDRHNGIFTLLDASYDLCQPCKADDETQQRLSLWSGQIATMVGLEAYEKDEEQREKSREFLKNVKPALIQALSGCLPPLERAEAGNALAYLGDPRPEIMQVDEMRFCFIPEGPFWWKKDEKIDLPAFWLAEYPVSAAQFETFVNEDGYLDERWWPEAIDAECWSKKGFKGRYDDKYRTRPVRYPDSFNLPNHPVVGVSWYEACAFTRWLEQRWQELGWFTENWHITLPSEQQWVKAARGVERIPGENSSMIYAVRQIKKSIGEYPDLVDNPQPQRLYAWGNTFDVNFANTSECGLSATNALGCFPSGAGPYGHQELCGNAWEWQENWYGPENRAKSLRGSSWDDYLCNEHISNQAWNGPDNMYNSIGFRCVLSLKS